MKRRFKRVIAFAVFIIVLGVGYNFFAVHFSGDGKDSPQEALPADANYEWIAGPKSDREERYFYLFNGDSIGTINVTKNFKGWSSGTGTSSPLPKLLEENQVNAAYSDNEILFGLLKPDGEVKVTVNGQKTERITLTSLSKEIVELYNIKGYEIWYIDLSRLNESKNYLIKVLDKNNSLVNELSI